MLLLLASMTNNRQTILLGCEGMGSLRRGRTPTLARLMERRDSGEGEARLRRDSSDQKGDQKGDGIVTAFTIALLWLPSILTPVVIQLMRCDECWAEPTAAFVCQLIVMPFVVLPVMMVVAIIMLPSLVPRPVASLAVIWFIWNAHIIGMTLPIVPFILASFHTNHMYSDILYDFFVFTVVSHPRGSKRAAPRCLRSTALPAYCVATLAPSSCKLRSSFALGASSSSQTRWAGGGDGRSERCWALIASW